MYKLNIVLVEPQIPQNTGNISRTCAVTGAVLHLIKPYGFEISDKHLKRAGLDYWNKLKIFEYESLDEFLRKTADRIITLQLKAKIPTAMSIMKTAVILFSEGKTKD